MKKANNVFVEKARREKFVGAIKKTFVEKTKFKKLWGAWLGMSCPSKHQFAIKFGGAERIGFKEYFSFHFKFRQYCVLKLKVKLPKK